MMGELRFDLVAAARSLRRKPAFTAVAALTLAMGVGATTVAFALVNQVLLKPLPGVRDPGGAAYVQFGQDGLSFPDFELLRRDASLVQGFASYAFTSLNVSRVAARPVQVQANVVVGDFFEVLGVRPVLGRLLAPSDGDIGGDVLVAVISERLRETLFGGVRDVVGKKLVVGDQSILVVGVAGGGFAGPERGRPVDLWMPWSAIAVLEGLPFDRVLGRESTGHGYLVTRPRAGTTFAAVEAQLAATLKRIATHAPDAESAERLSGLRPQVFAGLHAPPLFRATMYRSVALLTGIVALVLLITCANVANLLLFRGVNRRGEVATRRALGASAGRIARQHMAESLAIAVLGTSLGLGLGWLIGLPFRGLSLVRTSPFEGVMFDVRVLLFAGATILLSTLLFGAVPALLAGRSDPGSGLAEAATRQTRRGSLLRSGMASIQLALSMALLVGAFLLVRTVENLYAADTGIAFEGVASVNLDLRSIPLEGQDAVHHALVSAVERVPGVEAVALDTYGPFSGASFLGRIRLGEGSDSVRIGGVSLLATPGWFDVLGVRPISGSTFRPGDWQLGAPPRVILSEGLARRLFDSETAVGRLVAVSGTIRGPLEAEIVGVIPDLGLSGPGTQPSEFFVQPFAPTRLSYVTVLARTTVLDRRVLADITDAVERALPQVPVPDAVPLRKRIDDRLAEQRLFARMIGMVAALSVLLAAVGLYGVVAFTVAGRRREMGIRLALGADGRSLANLVARYALGIVGMGVALGMIGASWLEDLLNNWLFGLVPLDPVSYGGSILLFVGVAVLACWVPTRSAMRVDPAVTLRAE